MSYTLRAVVVGIDEYSDPRYRRISKLQCASNDAQAIASVLQTSTAYRLEANNPYLLTNKQTTERAVRSVMDKNFATGGLNRNTIALFYFAGHGVLKNERIYLCCHDMDFTSPEHGGIRLNQVYEWLTESSAECTIAIIDACFSGGLTTNMLDHVSAAERAKRAIEDLKAPDGKTIAIFAACGSDQQAREDIRLGHGIFTHQLLLGLRGRASDQDGIVTLSDLVSYLLKSFANEKQKPQISFRGSSYIPLWKDLSPVHSPTYGYQATPSHKPENPRVR
jgi:uncharacterized caspase-like protein